MAQIVARTVLSNVLKNRVVHVAAFQQRGYADESKPDIQKKAPEIPVIQNEADPKVYGYAMDDLEYNHPESMSQKQYEARFRGDDRYEQKVYYRAQNSTKDFPNLVPVFPPSRIRVIGCFCEPEANSPIVTFIHKGIPKRCKCGHWFLGVDADPDSCDGQY